MFIVLFDVLISAGGDKDICIIIGHLRFLVEVSMLGHLDWTLLVVLTCVLSFVSTAVRDSKDKRKTGSAIQSRTPAKGMTASYIPKYTAWKGIKS